VIGFGIERNNIMKIVLTLIFSTYLLAGNIPSWFQDQEITPKYNYEILGYGSGKSQQEAEELAMADIAAKIESRVVSETSVDMRLHKGEVEREFSHQIKTKSAVILHNARMIKHETVGNQVYVVMAYDNLPFAKRLAKKLSDKKCKNGQQNQYLKQTPLLQDIYRETHCMLDAKLQRKDHIWQIEIDETLIPITQFDLEKLFVSVDNPNLQLAPSKNPLRRGDEFWLNITSKKDGYVTLLTVYENGIVTVLQPSTRIKKDKNYRLPEDKELYFEAALLDSSKGTYDLYVAIWSESSLNTSRFEYASAQIAGSEQAYKFHELLDLMDKKVFSALLIHTKP